MKGTGNCLKGDEAISLTERMYIEVATRSLIKILWYPEIKPVMFV